MSILVQRWLVGSIWGSCFFVSPAVFVFSSQLGHSFTSSCQPPWLGALFFLFLRDITFGISRSGLRVVNQNQIFYKVTPSQKNKIIQA